MAKTSGYPYSSVAIDTFMMGSYVSKYGQRVRKVIPVNLNLFQLAILASVVHKQSSLFSLFENQCYWYASLIVDAVIALGYSGEHHCYDRGGVRTMDRVYFPNDYCVPDLAGRWIEISIGKVEHAVLSIVRERFEEVREEKINEVSRVSIMNWHLLIPKRF